VVSVALELVLQGDPALERRDLESAVARAKKLIEGVKK
jgi:hypothetical protein